MKGYINTLDGWLLMQVVFKQALESSYLVENSNSPDTVIERCSFLKSNVGHIRECREQPEFNIELQSAIDEFKQSYYDRIITKTQLSLLLTATPDQFRSFYFTNIERSVYQFFDKQLAEIGALSRPKAKEKRISNLNRMVLDTNSGMIRLFSPVEKEDPYWHLIEDFTKRAMSYVDLKLSQS